MEYFGIEMGSVPPGMQQIYDVMRQALETWKVFSEPGAGELQLILRWGEPEVTYALTSSPALRRAALSLREIIKGRAVRRLSAWNPRVIEIRMIPDTAQDGRTVSKMAFILFLWMASQHPHSPVWDSLISRNPPVHSLPVLGAHAPTVSRAVASQSLPLLRRVHVGGMSAVTPPKSIATRSGG
jgi:hypothetical protein